MERAFGTPAAYRPIEKPAGSLMLLRGRSSGARGATGGGSWGRENPIAVTALITAKAAAIVAAFFTRIFLLLSEYGRAAFGLA
jgi:hypothetical protein